MTYCLQAILVRSFDYMRYYFRKLVFLTYRILLIAEIFGESLEEMSWDCFPVNGSVHAGSQDNSLLNGVIRGERYELVCYCGI